MRVIGAEEVERTLYDARCVEAMRRAFVLSANGGIRQPPRAIVDLGDGAGMAFMPGAVVGAGSDSAGSSAWIGAKLMARFADAEARRHVKAGAFLLFDRETRGLAAIVDAPSLTNARTAAATVAATDALAHGDAGVVALLGAGTLARAHAKAFDAWPRTRKLLLWGRDLARAQRLADTLAASLRTPLQVVPALEDAVQAADVVCTLTAAGQPFLSGRLLRPGQHLNAVGSSTPAEQEIDLEAVARAQIFVDSRSAAAAAAAELRAAVAAGRIGAIETLPELGAVLCGAHSGRSGPEQITLFKSLGLFAQDCLAAELLLSQQAAAQDAASHSAA